MSYYDNKFRQKPTYLINLELKFISCYLWFLNASLAFLEFILFPFKVKNPQKILVYKVGNVGDTICAMPSLLAIREAFPEAFITLLTSPGDSGAPGARELLHGSGLFNETRAYYSEDIDTRAKKKTFIKNLKSENYDLFIQLPEDLARFRTIFRNLIFVKMIGAKSALGFRINSSQIFKKAQVDNLVAPQETDRLLNLLERYGIKNNKAEFRFNISNESKEKVKKLLNYQLPITNSRPLVAINPGGKRAANCWSVVRYRDLAKYLHEKYHANIVVAGGPHEKMLGDEALKLIPVNSSWNACGALSLLETAELLRHVSILISNSTGTIHLGAAVGVPCVGIYTIRDIPGKWSPYGKGHKMLYHLNFSCDYNSEECIKKSVDSITLEEAKDACDAILKNL